MTSISDEMAKAGATILDPMLSSDCPLKVARDVYAAMREAEGVRDETPEHVAPEWLNDAERRGQAIQEEARRGLTYAGELRSGPIPPIEQGPEQANQVHWHRIAEICLPRPEDGLKLRARADGMVEAVPHPAVNRTGEAEGPNIPTAATKLRPRFFPNFEG